MERAEWLKQMCEKAEALYDHMSPLYWVKFGLREGVTHRQYLQKLIERMPACSNLLSAACGAGLHDGLLLETGHRVFGIDQSQKMLARAREHFPEVRYENIGLQEMDYQNAFHGATCIDAMQHVCPEDWPGILQRLRKALKAGGILYFTADLGGDYVKESYQRAVAMGLPVLPDEVADRVEEGFAFFMSFEDVLDIPEDTLWEKADSAVYHYCPSLEQVRTWIDKAGFVIEEEEPGKWYEHFLVRKM